MKRASLFIALTILATSLFAIGVFAVDGTMADAVPANYGVIADFNPEAITEDISVINGNQKPVVIAGSAGIASLAGHTSSSADSIGVSLVEENGEKFVRFSNTAAYTAGKYSQLYFNLDTGVFTKTEEFYFTITFRLNNGYACNDSKDRAVLARLIDGPKNTQNNCVIVNRADLAAKDYTQWTTLTFKFTPADVPTRLNVITFSNPSDYVDIKDLKIYAASVTPTTEPVTEAVTTEAVTTEAVVTEAVTTATVEGGEITPPTGDISYVLLAACFLAAAAIAVLSVKKAKR